MKPVSCWLCLLMVFSYATAASFTSYVPEYQMGLPEGPAQYGFYPYINANDPYLSVIRSEKRDESSGTFSVPTASASSAQTFPLSNFGTCQRPLQNIGGVCRCPNNGIFIAPLCLNPSSVPNLVCKPPSTQINLECICPNGKKI